LRDKIKKNQENYKKIEVKRILTKNKILKKYNKIIKEKIKSKKNQEQYIKHI
jgi:hypothetical protein